MGVPPWGRDTQVQEHSMGSLGPAYIQVSKSFWEPVLWLPLFQAGQGNVPHGHAKSLFTNIT